MSSGYRISKPPIASSGSSVGNPSFSAACSMNGTNSEITRSDLLLYPKCHGSSPRELYNYLTQLRDVLLAIPNLNSEYLIGFLESYDRTSTFIKVIFPFSEELQRTLKPNWEIYSLIVDALKRKGANNNEFIDNLRIVLQNSVDNEFDCEFKVKVMIAHIDAFVNSGSPKVQNCVIWRKIYGVLQEFFSYMFHQLVLKESSIRTFLQFDHIPHTLDHWILVRKFLSCHYEEEEGYSFLKAREI